MHVLAREKGIAMIWQHALAVFAGLKSLMTQVTAGVFRQRAIQAFAENYEDTTILIVPASSFKLCRFVNCRFEWAGEPTNIFSDCTFDNCDLGMPLHEFLVHTHGSIFDQEPQPLLTRRLALEEAVRRIRRRHPRLTVQCLDPCCRDERQFIAQWVSAEYHNIIADAA